MSFQLKLEEAESQPDYSTNTAETAVGEPLCLVKLPAPSDSNPIIQAIRALIPILNLETGPWIAGGAARRIAEGETVIEDSDIDIFFQSEEMANWVYAYFSDIEKNATKKGMIFTISNFSGGTNPKFKVVHNGATHTVQLIKHRFYESYQELIQGFDYTTCMYVTDTFEMIGDERAVRDSGKRLIVYNRKPRSPYAHRLLKYCVHGFTPGPGVLSTAMGIDSPRFTLSENLQCTDGTPTY